jgi:hypothetical protein
VKRSLLPDWLTVITNSVWFLVIVAILSLTLPRLSSNISATAATVSSFIAGSIECLAAAENR